MAIEAETPAQRLRDAARGMREKAEAATPMAPAPWRASLGLQVRSPNGTVACWDCCGGNPSAFEPVQDYIAAMSPNVALAVADLLDMTADLLPPDPHGEDEDCCCCRHARDALAVADTFLGVKHE